MHHSDPSPQPPLLSIRRCPWLASHRSGFPAYPGLCGPCLSIFVLNGRAVFCSLTSSWCLDRQFSISLHVLCPDSSLSFFFLLWLLHLNYLTCLSSLCSFFVHILPCFGFSCVQKQVVITFSQISLGPAHLFQLQSRFHTHIGANVLLIYIVFEKFVSKIYVIFILLNNIINLKKVLIYVNTLQF